MPLQNRVTPFGDVVALPGRGTIMGNRGILHDDARRVVRQHQVRRWIACRLEWRGRKRTVMAPHRYTELFFVDEAAAFSAGHRPCAECRREDYRTFCRLWEASACGPASADAIDLVLHAERLDGRSKRTYRAAFSDLPDGTYVAWNARPWLVWGDLLFLWTDRGYAESAIRPRTGDTRVLTPPSIVRTFLAGYRPALHPSVLDRARRP
jgi:hypothetical protein